MKNVVDHILEDWSKEMPDETTPAKGVIISLIHCYATVYSSLELLLKPLDITPTIFSALVAIRRSGPDAEIPVKNIMEQALVTSGAASNLINQLIKLDLITKRKANTKEDARSVFVKLTPHGLAFINKLIPIITAWENKITRSLSKPEKSKLTLLLKKIISDY